MIRNSFSSYNSKLSEISLPGLFNEPFWDFKIPNVLNFGPEKCLSSESRVKVTQLVQFETFSKWTNVADSISLKLSNFESGTKLQFDLWIFVHFQTFRICKLFEEKNLDQKVTSTRDSELLRTLFRTSFFNILKPRLWISSRS